MSHGKVGRYEKSRKNKVLIFVEKSSFSVHSGCTTENSVKVLYVNTVTLNLCSVRPTLKAGKKQYI